MKLTCLLFVLILPTMIVQLLKTYFILNKFIIKSL